MSKKTCERSATKWDGKRTAAQRAGGTHILMRLVKSPNGCTLNHLLPMFIKRIRLWTTAMQDFNKPMVPIPFLKILNPSFLLSRAWSEA
jgi:hypothetical protein